MSNLKEGVDYYINKDGLFVFTEAYHLRRGYCCKSGCLHCPYGFGIVPKETLREKACLPYRQGKLKVVPEKSLREK
ncbi:MAG: DUF5522 domain-containing protein [Chitinophagales bacterium]|nr:DUF5522 domain-containing protein [Chitinophagales bacterium]